MNRDKLKSYHNAKLPATNLIRLPEESETRFSPAPIPPQLALKCYD
jgi:hypothetical protein